VRRINPNRRLIAPRKRLANRLIKAQDQAQSLKDQAERKTGQSDQAQPKTTDPEKRKPSTEEPRQ
jgi:hypothetical protein